MEFNIEKIFASLPDPKRELALKVRDIILKSDKSITRTISAKRKTTSTPLST